MSIYLSKQVTSLFICCVMLVSCGEKVKMGDQSELEEPRAKQVATEEGELIECTFDGTSQDGGNVYKVSAQIYDAPALPLGEIYTSRKQLEVVAVRKVAEFTNLVNSGEVAELTCKTGHFKTDAIAGENGQLMDATVDLKLEGLEMKFSTVLKFGFPAFYEVSVAGKQGRVNVVVVNVVKEGGEL